MTCSGVYTALITPFDANGAVDEEGVRALVQRQIRAQVDGLVAVGTTAETPTLLSEEKKRILQIVRKESQSLPLMVGCGTNSTSQTIENIQLAADLGANSALVVTPYYNKPTQEGLRQHFTNLSKASPIPIFLYNNPGRTAVNIEISTLKYLLELPNIVGIKETSGNLVHASNILSTSKKIRPDFSVVSGDDNLTLAIMAIGGGGVISGGANLIPTMMKELVSLCQNQELQKAQELNLSLTPLFKALLLESNPIPLKAALKLCGLPAGHPRLPLTPLSEEYLPLLEDALQTLNILATV